MPSLFVIQGRDQGKRFELDRERLTVGRERTNDIQLHDTEVSRRHAELRSDGDAIQLVDLDSSNGTFVNSDRVSSRRLQSGDRILIGRTRMIFTAADESSAGAAGVDIVARGASETGSRIVRSISQEEGSRIFSGDELAHSPWLARARSNLQVMYRTALAVSHTLDIDQLLHRIMELIFEWVEADRGCIMLVDDETDELTPSVTHRRRSAARQGSHSPAAGQQAAEPSDPYSPQQGDKPQHSDKPSQLDKLSISRTILDYVMEHREGVWTSDAREDDRWESAASIVSQGVREAICVPMQGRYGIVGVIYIDTFTPPGERLQRRGNRFSEDHLKLMVAIGHQAALAVEDTSYYSAMVQAERLAAMGQAIATLSHHVKNILQGIRGGSYLIQEGLKGAEWEVVRKGWGIVERNQEKISNLVMDMLSFSKEREPEMVTADLNAVATDVVELMQVRAAEAGVTLRWEADAGLPKFTFDPEALHRAILNIVTNAIDACEHVERAEVVVQTHYDFQAQLAQVIVADNGEGIDPDELRKLFSLFASKKGSRGTGLGLPVSQKILREHQGDIHVESSPGAGSRFVLEFPAVAAEDTPSEKLNETTRFQP